MFLRFCTVSETFLLNENDITMSHSVFRCKLEVYQHSIVTPQKSLCNRSFVA